MLFKFKIIGILHFLVNTLMLKCKIAGSAALQCGRVSQLPHWGAALPSEICRNTGIPAKSVNYFYGNMKDAK
jgi:hypothetical protein